MPDKNQLRTPELLANLRIAHGYRTRAALARKANVSEDTIGRLERGDRMPNEQMLRYLAIQMGLSDADCERLLEAARSDRASSNLETADNPVAPAPAPVVIVPLDVPQRILAAKPSLKDLALVVCALVLVLSGLGVVIWRLIPPAPVVTYYVQRVGWCSWDVYLQGSHLQPGTHMTVDVPHYLSISCATGQSHVTAWGHSLPAGQADPAGDWRTGYQQGDYGTYDYVVTDDQGHVWRLTITYDNKTTLSACRTPTTLPPTSLRTSS